MLQEKNLGLREGLFSQQPLACSIQTAEAFDAYTGYSAVADAGKAHTYPCFPKQSARWPLITLRRSDSAGSHTHSAKNSRFLARKFPETFLVTCPGHYSSSAESGRTSHRNPKPIT
eukprot:scaffold340434_cov15-Prasinocladus_malaysianus.AAC.1